MVFARCNSAKTINSKFRSRDINPAFDRVNNIGFTLIEILVGLALISISGLIVVLLASRIVAIHNQSLSYGAVDKLSTQLDDLIRDPGGCDKLFSQNTLTHLPVATLPTTLPASGDPPLRLTWVPVGGLTDLVQIGSAVGLYKIRAIELNVFSSVGSSYFSELKLTYSSFAPMGSTIANNLVRSHFLQFYLDSTQVMHCQQVNAVKGFQTIFANAILASSFTYDPTFFDGNFWNSQCKALTPNGNFYLAEVDCPNNWVPINAGFYVPSKLDPANAPLGGSCITQYSNPDRNNPTRWKVFLCCETSVVASTIVNGVYGICQKF